MSDDIVDRLRKHAVGNPWDRDLVLEAADEMDKAADEIERLRALIEEEEL